MPIVTSRLILPEPPRDIVKLQENPTHILVPARYFFPMRELGFLDLCCEYEIWIGRVKYKMMAKEI